MKTPLDIDTDLRLDLQDDMQTLLFNNMMSLASGNRPDPATLKQQRQEIQQTHRDKVAERRWQHAETLFSIQPKNLWMGDKLFDAPAAANLILPLLLACWHRASHLSPSHEHFDTFEPYFRTHLHRIDPDLDDLPVVYGMSLGLYGHGLKELPRMKQGNLPSSSLSLLLCPSPAYRHLSFPVFQKQFTDHPHPLPMVDVYLKRGYWSHWRPEPGDTSMVHDRLCLHRKLYGRMLESWLLTIGEALGLTTDCIPTYSGIDTPAWVERLRDPSIDLGSDLNEYTQHLDPGGQRHDGY